MTKLQDQLDQISEKTRRLVQPERLQPSENALAELFASGIEQRILPVGAAAPDFSLRDHKGKIVRAADLLALGPLILKFFRGRWCPYCMAELSMWRDLYAKVRARGVLLVAISPQTVHQNDLLVQQHNLPFPVLRDAGCTLAEKFHLTYEVPEYHRQHFRRILVNLPFINDDASWRLALPATYVAHRNGDIAYAQAHADFRVRPDPEEVLAAL